MFALEKIKVIDLTNYIAGSYCCMLLADMGAKVIKIETHEGDPFRGMARSFIGWNRGKRGMVLDLKQPQGKEVLLELVKGADVLVENYRPGVADRLGIGYDDLKAINPQLIYCALSAWGQTGPYVDKPGFDPLMQALGGVMYAQGFPNDPVFSRVAVSDYTAAFLGAYGIAVALFVRSTTGIAQRVDTALINCVIAIQSAGFVKTAEPDRVPLGGLVPYQLFRTADHWMFVACGNDNFWRKFCKAVDIETFAFDPRYVTGAKRNENREELLGTLQEILLTKSTDEWIRILERHDVPCAPVRRLDQLFDDPQVLHNEMVVEHDHPEVGKLWQMGIPVKLSETPGHAYGPALTLGQHSAEILAELGYTPDQIEAMKKRKVI